MALVSVGAVLMTGAGYYVAHGALGGITVSAALSPDDPRSSGNNMNINAQEIMANGNNPQAGAPVPQAFKDVNLNTIPDKNAVSGPVWTLANGQVQC